MEGAPNDENIQNIMNRMHPTMDGAKMRVLNPQILISFLIAVCINAFMDSDETSLIREYMQA